MTATFTDNRPLVSVVIPAKNAASTLSATLAGLVGQTYTNWNAFIVNNRSTDSTADIIKYWQTKDSRINYLFEPKPGRGAARKTGVEAATGSIIALTDADCLVPPEWLKKITHAINNKPAAVITGVINNVEIGNRNSEFLCAADNEFIKQSRTGERVCHLSGGNMAGRAEIFAKINFDRQFKAMEDFDLYLQLKYNNYSVIFHSSISVKHHYKNNLMSMAVMNFSRGYWMGQAYVKHRKYIDANQELIFNNLRAYDWLIFPGRLAMAYFTTPFSDAFRQTNWEIAWRAGLFWFWFMYYLGLNKFN